MISKKMWQQAIDVQNACNLSGVAFAFGAVVQAVCDEAQELGQGTDYRNSHPIIRLWLDKMCHLADIQIFDGDKGQRRIDEAFEEAYRQTREEDVQL